MRFYSLVLAYAMFCGLASAASCTKDISPGIQGLNPFSFLVLHPDTYIFVKSGGHTIEFIFVEGDPGGVEILVDGQVGDVALPGNNASPYSSSPEALVASLCGPGFLPSERVSGFSRNSTASTDALPGTVSGHTTEDVVIGDFNGDGVPDSASLTGNGIFVALLDAKGKNLSSARYSVAGIGVAQNIIAADFNGDGVLDLAVTTGTFSTSVNPYPPGNVMILLGNGDGTFRAPVPFPAGPVGNSYLASGDFNGDGIIDLALTHTVAKGSGQVAVLLGKGDGSFGPAVDYPVGPSPFTLVAADFTGDGLLDLAALDAFGLQNKIWVLPGRGDGTFQAAVSSSSLTKEGFLGYADLNHDGNLDLVIADEPASAMEVMLGNGDGTFQAGKEYLIGAHPTSIAIVPLQDGNTALFTADNDSNDNLYLSFVSSDGVGHSPELQTLGVAPSAAAAADLNGDGQPDLVIADPSSGQLYVKLANGKGSFADPVAYPGGIQPGAIAIADLNGDGKPDVIAGDYFGLNVLLGKGDGALGAMTTFSAGGALTSVAVADFDLDGNPDVAAVSSQAGGVALFLGNGSGTFQSARILAVPNALAAVVGDFNGDGKPDLAVSVGPIDFQTPGSIAIQLGNGDGTFQTPFNMVLPGPFFSTALAVADLNGDGKLDLVTTVFGGSRSLITILLGNGDGTFQAPIQIDSNTASPSISVVDLNGDGNPDLLLADCCGLAEASYMLGKGDGSFQPEVQFPSGPNPQAIAVADFNGDGKPDLAIVGQIQEAIPRRGTLAFWFNAFSSPTPSGANNANVVAPNPAGPSSLPNTREHP